MSYETREAFEQGHSPDGAHAFGEGLWIPAADFMTVAVTNVTYQGMSAGAVAAVGLAEQNALAGMDYLHIIDTTTAASAVIDIPVSPVFGKFLTGTKGAYIKDVSIPYSVNAQVLTAVMTLQAFVYSFPAPTVAAAAPAAGATITATLVASSCPLAVNTAGRFQTAQWTLAGGLAATGDYQVGKLRLTVPMTAAGTVDLAGCFVRFGIQ